MYMVNYFVFLSTTVFLCIFPQNNMQNEYGSYMEWGQTEKVAWLNSNLYLRTNVVWLKFRIW